MKISSQEQFSVTIDRLIQEGIKTPKGTAWVKINNKIAKNPEFKLNHDQLNTLEGMKFKKLSNENKEIINNIVKSQLHRNHPLSRIEKAKIQTNSIETTPTETSFSEKAKQWLEEAKYHNPESLKALIEAIKNPENRLTDDQIEKLRLLKLASQSDHMIALYTQAILHAVNAREVLLPPIAQQLTTGRIDFEPQNIPTLERLSKEGNGQASYTLGMGYCTRIDMTTLKRSENDLKKGISFLTRAVLQGYPNALEDIGRFLPENLSLFEDKGTLSYWGLGKILQINGYHEAAELVFAEGKKNQSFYCSFEGSTGKTVPSHFNLLIKSRKSPTSTEESYKSLLKNITDPKYANDPETNYRLYLGTSKSLLTKLFTKDNSLEFLLQAALQGHLEALKVIYNEPWKLNNNNVETYKDKILDFMQKNPAAQGQCEILLAIIHREKDPKTAKQYFELAASRGHPVARIFCYLVYGDDSFTTAQLAESVKCGFLPLYQKEHLEKLIHELKQEHLDEALLCVMHLSPMKKSKKMMLAGDLCAEKTDKASLRKGLDFYEKALEELIEESKKQTTRGKHARSSDAIKTVESHLRIIKKNIEEVKGKIKEVKSRIE